MQTSLCLSAQTRDSLFDTAEIIRRADAYLSVANPHITSCVSPLSAGTPHDFFSTGDYWWPNLDTADGLPFVRRDGESYPGGFFAHRTAMRAMRDGVASLAAAYKAAGQSRYAQKAADMLRVFFVDEQTRMNPHLRYAQAIPGVCEGRGIGVIDTLHLIDVPYAIDALRSSDAMTDELYQSLRRWFADYLRWMRTDPQGVAEMNEPNNHGVCWNVQAACFAVFTGDDKAIELCKRRFREVYLTGQMAADGSFPLELERTKPYNYSNFVLDNIVNTCLILSDTHDDLWSLALPDGRCVRRGLDFLFPYVEDISRWPYAKDVEHFDEFPAAFPYLLFVGIRFGDERYLQAYQRLSARPKGDELLRNIAIREPYLFL